ncbi:hypothetical protein [Nocardia asteroides]
MMARRLITVLAATVVAAVGCSTNSSPDPVDPTTEIRHDLEPLTKRFSLIGSPVAASWITWNNDGGRAPGPTTHWIQAVVELRPEVADELRSRFNLAAVQLSEFKTEIQPSIPPGGYVSSPEFNEAFSDHGWKAGAYLQVDGHMILLNAVD